MWPPKPTLIVISGRGISREPPEAAVPEARLFLLVEKLLEIEAELLHSLPRRVEGSEVEEIVA